MEKVIVCTGWITNAAETADNSNVFQVNREDVSGDGIEFLEENGWWREESKDDTIQRHYWIRD